MFDPERMIEPISVRWLDSAVAAREGALEPKLCTGSRPSDVEPAGPTSSFLLVGVLIRV